MVKYIFYLRDVFLMNRKRVIFVLMLSIATLMITSY